MDGSTTIGDSLPARIGRIEAYLPTKPPRVRWPIKGPKTPSTFWFFRLI